MEVCCPDPVPGRVAKDARVGERQIGDRATSPCGLALKIRTLLEITRGLWFTP